MKIKFKILTIMMAIVLILASCGSNNGGESPTPTEPQSAGNNTNSPVTTEEKSKYFFEHNGISIYMNDKAEPVLDALGEPMHYFESPSCAFQGIDRVYTYSGFELYTYTDGDDDTEYIFSVVFMNDGVETREGITLSNSSMILFQNTVTTMIRKTTNIPILMRTLHLPLLLRMKKW